jgi:hypothetical protein
MMEATVREFLLNLPASTILRIARDLGYTHGNAIDFIVEQAKTYRWNIADLKPRYNIAG